MILRVPDKLLKRLNDEKGLAFLVSITSHMVGEMKKPSSLLINADKLAPETKQLLLDSGCKEVKQ